MLTRYKRNVNGSFEFVIAFHQPLNGLKVLYTNTFHVLWTSSENVPFSICYSTERVMLPFLLLQRSYITFLHLTPKDYITFTLNNIKWIFKILFLLITIKPKQLTTNKEYSVAFENRTNMSKTHWNRVQNYINVL